MALEVHIAGPGLDLKRRLAVGEPALILGRDADCSVCLPDADRNISRRHLSVWNEADQLHFHVLSVVNGVATRAGELPPGARGVLAPGAELALSAYRLRVTPVDADAPASAGSPAEAADPWTEFERQAAQLAAEAGLGTVPRQPEDDPFGDWGFQTTFGPGTPGGGLSATALAPATDLRPFFAGLGLAGLARAGLTEGEMETIGRLTRTALQGLLQATQAAAVGRTEVQPREANALRMDTPLEAKLDYLFGGQAAAAGFMPADRAVAQLVAELAAHQEAMGEAARDAVQAVLDAFDPEALKLRLLGPGNRLFAAARAWEAFARDHAERRQAEPDEAQALLEHHLARAYARALLRVKRDTGGRADH